MDRYREQHTLGNEHKQIIAFFTVFSKGTREMFNTCYPAIYRHYRLHDMEMPVIHYVDNPEEVQAAIGRKPAIIPSLSDGARFQSRQFLGFGLNSIMLCDDLTNADMCARALLAEMDENRLIGLDIEWDAFGQGDSTGRPTTVGLSCGQFVVIVHTAKLPAGLPQPFIDILEDASIRSARTLL
jgi:hypothetical protein